MGSFVDLTAADGFAVPAYVALPSGTPKGGVVVLQEIFGVNVHIRAVADAYAAKGFLAVAPALFQRFKPNVELGYSPEDVQAGVGFKKQAEGEFADGVRQDVQAAIAYAGQAGKVGTVGYCWGGLLSWRAAAQAQGLSAAVCYYGGGMTVGAERDRKPQVPVLAHFGRKDHGISVESVQDFTQAQPGVEVHLYDADHGFNCDLRGAWDAPSAQLALERTLAFYAKHLG